MLVPSLARAAALPALHMEEDPVGQHQAHAVASVS